MNDKTKEREFDKTYLHNFKLSPWKQRLNYKGKISNFTLEKPNKQNLNQVIKVTSPILR